MNKHNYSKNIERALEIMGFFREHHELSIKELAILTGENKSVVHRTVNTLTYYSYLEKDPKTKNYRLGLALIELGSIVSERFSLKNLAHPYLEQLTLETEETSVLSVLMGNEILCIDKVDADLPIKIALEVGNRYSVYAGASPKVILAFMPEEQRDLIVGDTQFKKFTDSTITNLDELRDELRKIRDQNYAVARGELNALLCSVAAPLFNQNSTLVGSVGISGLYKRFDEQRIPILIKKVKNIAERISGELGYKMDDKLTNTRRSNL